MAKKHKSHEKQVQNVIQSLKDLGVGGKETLNRLATTVRADAPTMILAATASKLHAGKGAKMTVAMRAKAGLSRVAQRLHPLGEPAAQRQVARELKRLQKRVKRANQGPKVRKSRLPHVIAFALLLALGGGYWAYTKISLPDVKVSQYLDYKKWLAHTSGQKVEKAGPKKTEANFVEQKMPEPVLASPTVAPKARAIPKAPRILVHASSKGAVGAQTAKVAKRQAAPISATRKKPRTSPASFRQTP